MFAPECGCYDRGMNVISNPDFGNQLKLWRSRRRMSQLDLALEADISTRHLSFVETGRSQPSREMVMHLAERLDVPLRDQNRLLVAAGFAPVFSERDIHSPEMQAARRAIEVILTGHEPFPALVVDRHWTLVEANRMIPLFLEGVPPDMLKPPINVARISLHPNGLADRIVNYGQWRAHFVDRLRSQIDASGDESLVSLLDEINAYPYPDNAAVNAEDLDLGGVAIPFRLRTDHGILSTYTTTTVFGTPVEITLQELAIESFFPADTQTAEILQDFANSLENA